MPCLHRSRGPLRGVVPGLAVLALVALVGSCSDDAAQPAATEPLLTTTSVAPVDDGVLRLGILLPSGGAGAELGQSLADGIDLALQQINASGGVNGEPVRRIVRSEGDDIVAATAAMQTLVDAAVDAIIGPASSNSTLAALGTAVAAGRVTCSPTASTMALDAYPDNGLFFRTIPSDSLQAWGIARAVDETGTDRATIVYIDDAYGRPFADEVSTAITALGIEVAATVPYTRAEASIAEAARTVADGVPRAVVVIGDSATGPAMLTATDLAIGNGSVSYVVNDAMRRPAATVQPFTPDVAPRIVGVSPRATSPSAAFAAALLTVNPRATGLYSANSYNCVNLIALAATIAGSTLPLAIARVIPTVAVNGSRCTDFPSCAELLAAGRNIDYDGPNGDLTIGTEGDRVSAEFELFGFDDSGRDVSRGQLTVLRP